MNLQGGEHLEDLTTHLRMARSYTHVFAFQEDNYELHPKIRDAMPEFKGSFEPSHDDEGLSFFIRNDVKMLRSETRVVHQHVNAQSGEVVDQNRIVHSVDVEVGGKVITIINFHGLNLGANKRDTADRDIQFALVKAFLDGIAGPKVLCMDANVEPDTAAIKMLEAAGDTKNRLENLVRPSVIATTRTPYYGWREEQPYADYIMVSPEPALYVNKFQVLTNVVVSDHYPLTAEVE